MNILTGNKNDKWIIALICILAAARVFFYSASFPFFTNLDEQAHLDLVIKYSSGHYPQSFEKLSTETAYYIPRYESPEYFNVAADQPGGKFQAPSWTKPESLMQRYYQEGTAYWSNNYVNHESSQAPLYYFLAGIWMNIGQLLGITGGYLLYWIRFLNILFIVSLVVIASEIAKELFPEDAFLSIAVPALVAFIPQDSYYTIENDVLSPVFFGITFLFLIKYFNSQLRSKPLAIATGISLAATMLVKTTNLPLLPVVLISILVIAIKSRKVNREILLSLSIIFACAIIPMILWCTRNYQTFGDLTGSIEKIKILGWTTKAISDWYPHPIFSISGMKEFLSGLIATFWRGELIWNKSMISNHALDLFFIISSIIFLSAAVIVKNDNGSSKNKIINRIAIICILAMIAYMGILSISFDFGNCENPSRAHPYFVSGRLITSVLIPFSVLYLQGMKILLRPLKNNIYKLLVLAIVIAWICTSEFNIHESVFKSPYNYFHLN